MGNLNLNVTIDSHSGFCFGVVYAIQMAEEILEEHGRLFCLGDIVHNDEEVARLNAKGLVTIDHEQLRELRNERVLIRAHGEPPKTYKTALENNIELIDASCPVVLKLQHRVREAYYGQEESPVYILGKHGHAEVKGLVGQTRGDAVVFESLEELLQHELPPKITLFSQTTKDMRKFYHIRDVLKEKGIEVNFNDTLCRQVSNRDLELREFAQQYDAVVFVAGIKSSNGKVLYEVCREFNPRSHFVSSPADIDASWFRPADRIGIAGATSTPLWLMEQVKEALETL